MEPDILNRAIIAGIADSAVPRVDRARIIQEFGADRGPQVADEVLHLVQEAASIHIDWGSKSLKEGVEEILRRMQEAHPELCPEALHEIGRCVGWQLR